MNTRLMILLLVGILLFSAMPTALSQSECDFSYSNYARAVQLHDMGDYERARHHYDCALAEDPDSQILPILIENLREDSASASAAWSANGASQSTPLCLFKAVHLMLAEAALARGEQDQALIHLQCAGQADPLDITLRDLTGGILANRPDPQSAQPVINGAQAAQAQEFQMPDWLRPYETMPDSRAVEPPAVLVLFRLRVNG